MKNQHVVAGARGVVGIDATQRVMAGAGNALARMLVGFPDIDQHRALAHKFGGAFGRNCLQVSSWFSPGCFVGPSHGQ